ncbi:RNA-binding domain-containing protein [Persicitalea sp.]|uniref:RNA-binding domain-containing protein n=1 Tax=Persicitalea sp. TaxID=3100273 RepID=UPI003593DD81
MLPINLNDLLGARTVESNRIEFKEGRNPDAIYRTICAFANDFDNTGGGYVVIGVAEERGRARRPVMGLTTDEIAKIQREMIGFDNLIRPVYHPRLFVEETDDKQIIVLWVPGSANRPHEVPEKITDSRKTYHNYLRQYASSVKASPAQKQELIALTNQVPFDDRLNIQASLADISLLWIKEYLRVSRARLFEQVDALSTAALLDQMELLSGPPGHRFPRNVALMLFCETPEKFFPYTYIELVDFQRGAGSKTFTEHTFRGPVQHQIRQLMDKLRTLALVEMVIKVEYQSESLRPWSYPVRAVEEAIANCIFHRDYQRHDPVRVFLHPDRLIFQNGGGPDRAIQPEDFATGRVQPRHYRNRRLGSFLKALQLTEGYATGIQLILNEMSANGSAPPVFSMDEERTYFAVEFEMHPAFSENLTERFLKETESREPRSPMAEHLKRTSFPIPLTENERNEFPSLVSSSSLPSIRMLRNLSGKRLRSRKELLKGANLSNHTDNAKRHFEPLLSADLLTLTDPESPRSPRQKYYLTEHGERLAQYLFEQKISDDD